MSGALVPGLLGAYSGVPEDEIPPPPEWLALYIYGLFRVQLMRFLSNVGANAVVTSGYRSPSKNESVGGAANSAHMHGLGADLVLTGGDVTYRELAAAWRRETGGVAIIESDHIHLNLSRSWGWSVIRALSLVIALAVVVFFLYSREVLRYARKKNR